MKNPPFARFAFDSRNPDLADPFEAYHDLYAVGSDVQRVGARFEARFEARLLDRLVLFDRHLNDVAHERTATRVRADGFTHFTLQLVLSGRMRIELATGAREVRPGEIAVFDLTRPQRTLAFDARILTFSVPRDIVEHATIHAMGLHGTVLDTAQGALLADVMVSIVKRRLAETTSDPAGVVRVLQAGLALALRREDDGLDKADTVEILERVRLVVEAHLGRRDLTPAIVAHLSGVSRTQLYALFKPMGGVSRYIQDRRVARLRASLLHAGGRATSIEQLAFQAGFASGSHASRLFTQTYGTTPGRFRADGTDRTAFEPTRRSHFETWLRTLA